MSKEDGKTFVQQAAERGQQEALDGVIAGSLSLLGAVPLDFTISAEDIREAEDNLREAVRLRFGVIDGEQIDQKIRTLKGRHRQRVCPLGK